MSEAACLRPLLAIPLMALMLTMAACGFSVSDESSSSQPTAAQQKPVRYETVLATLRSAERDQLESAATLGIKFMVSGLSEDNAIQILHYRWQESRAENDTQGIRNVVPFSTTFSLRATPVILFRYQAVNEGDSAKDYDGVVTVTYSSDWQRIIDFEH